MLETVKRDWKSVLFQSVTTAFALVVLLVILTFALGNTQLQSLKVQKAIGCELGVPAPDGVRDQELLRKCWTSNDLEPPFFFQTP